MMGSRDNQSLGRRVGRKYGGAQLLANERCTGSLWKFPHDSLFSVTQEAKSARRVGEELLGLCNIHYLSVH